MIRGRFAPSPTGDLHLGNARTALLAWLQVRSAGGHLVMRVEDLDPGRSRESYIERQLEDLRWLGLDWDEGPDVGGPHPPYLQSQRSGLYDAALDRLEAAGLLYPCNCSRREIAAAASAPHTGDDEGPAYTGRCAVRKGSDVRAGGRACALRFRVPGQPVRFEDEVHGELTYDPMRESGDFVVRRKDGVASYQLAVVVDDAAMEITDVLRGDDLLPSTARQLLLYRALGLPPPRWTHVPLLLGADGERLSKRHGAVAIREHREAGIRPERLIGWLAASCGMAEAGEELAAAELIPRFSIDLLASRAPAVLTPLPRL